MFVQVITATTSDAAAVKAAMDRWQTELAAGSIGWLGTTAGVTADGRFVAFARFESAEQAQRNSDRPEQDAWWAETAKLFDGEPEFADSSDVVVDLAGDPDTAGFVQAMRGQSSDPARARELMGSHPDEWRSYRPDLIGSIAALYDDTGRWAMAAYFTTEAEARLGEKKEPPAELKAEMDELATLSVGETEYFDLTEPWLYKP
jgi:hypothetical protein